jgi:hypothetical protein
VGVTIALTCFHLNSKFGAIKSSSVVSLLSLGILELLSISVSLDYSFFANLIFGASFVGMSSSHNTTNKQIFLAGLCYVSLFLIFSDILKAHGGTLGLFAFLSCYMVSMLFKNIPMKKFLN